MKRMISVVLGVVCVVVSGVALADDDDVKKPGGKFAVTAYEKDRTTVIEVNACEVRRIGNASIPHCTEAVKKMFEEVRGEYCPKHPGEQWFMQISDGRKLTNHCRR